MTQKQIRDKLLTYYQDGDFDSVFFETDSYELACKIQGYWLQLGVRTDRVQVGSRSIIRPLMKLDERIMNDFLWTKYSIVPTFIVLPQNDFDSTLER